MKLTCSKIFDYSNRSISRRSHSSVHFIIENKETKFPLIDVWNEVAEIIAGSGINNIDFKTFNFHKEDSLKYKHFVFLPETVIISIPYLCFLSCEEAEQVDKIIRKLFP